MALDPRIILGVQTPGDIQEQTLQNQLRQQQVDQNQRTLEEQEANAGKPDLDEISKKLEIGTKLLSTVRDQASYDRAKQLAQQYGIEDLDMLPDQYDPQIIDQLGRATLTYKEQLDMQRQQQQDAFQQEKFGFEKDKFQKESQLEQQKLDAEKSKPAAYMGGGDTGRLVDRLIKEGQAKNVAEALQIIKGGAGATGKLTAEAQLGADAEAAKAFGKEQGQATFDLPRVRATAYEGITAIDNAMNSPGLKNITGWLSLAPITPGGERARAEALLDQVGGRQFLAAFESLKGGGQITEVEGTKAEQALAALGRAQKYEDVVQALNDLRGVIVRSVQAKEKAATQSRDQIKQETFQPPAPAAAGGNGSGIKFLGFEE